MGEWGFGVLGPKSYRTGLIFFCFGIIMGNGTGICISVRSIRIRACKLSEPCDFLGYCFFFGYFGGWDTHGYWLVCRFGRKGVRSHKGRRLFYFSIVRMQKKGEREAKAGRNAHRQPLRRNPPHLFIFIDVLVVLASSPRDLQHCPVF